MDDKIIKFDITNDNKNDTDKGTMTKMDYVNFRNKVRANYSLFGPEKYAIIYGAIITIDLTDAVTEDSFRTEEFMLCRGRGNDEIVFVNKAEDTNPEDNRLIDENIKVCINTEDNKLVNGIYSTVSRVYRNSNDGKGIAFVYNDTDIYGNISKSIVINSTSRSSTPNEKGFMVSDLSMNSFTIIDDGKETEDPVYNVTIVVLFPNVNVCPYVRIYKNIDGVVTDVSDFEVAIDSDMLYNSYFDSFTSESYQISNVTKSENVKIYPYMDKADELIRWLGEEKVDIDPNNGEVIGYKNNLGVEYNLTMTSNSDGSSTCNDKLVINNNVISSNYIVTNNGMVVKKHLDKQVEVTYDETGNAFSNVSLDDSTEVDRGSIEYKSIVSKIEDVFNEYMVYDDSYIDSIDVSKYPDGSYKADAIIDSNDSESIVSETAMIYPDGTILFNMSISGAGDPSSNYYTTTLDIVFDENLKEISRYHTKIISNSLSSYNIVYEYNDINGYANLLNLGYVYDNENVMVTGPSLKSVHYSSPELQLDATVNIEDNEEVYTVTNFRSPIYCEEDSIVYIKGKYGIPYAFRLED